jgi:hypothetical protein
MWSKKWYLKRNISRDAHLLNELQETDVPWDNSIVVSAGKLRKLWDSLSEVRSFLCERWLERTVLRSALLPVKTAQFTQFFRQVWYHTVKSLSLTESLQGALYPLVSLVWNLVSRDIEIYLYTCECGRPLLKRVGLYDYCYQYIWHIAVFIGFIILVCERRINVRFALRWPNVTWE